MEIINMTSPIWFYLGPSHALKQIFHLTPDSLFRGSWENIVIVFSSLGGDGKDVCQGPETGNVHRPAPMGPLCSQAPLRRRTPVGTAGVPCKSHDVWCGSEPVMFLSTWGRSKISIRLVASSWGRVASPHWLQSDL